MIMQDGTCKRCEPRVNKQILRKMRRVWQRDDNPPGIIRGLIHYRCDVGVKSVLRSFCNFFWYEMYSYLDTNNQYA